MRRAARITIWLVALLLAPTLILAADSPATQPRKQISNPEYSYTLTCPQGFRPDKPPKDYQKTFLVSESENNDDVFLESISLKMLVEVEKNADLDVNFKAYRASMERSGTTIVEAQKTTLDGLPAYRTIYSHLLTVEGQALRIKGVEWFTIRGKQVWTLDARGEERRFDWLQKAADQVAASVHWQ